MLGITMSLKISARRTPQVTTIIYFYKAFMYNIKVRYQFINYFNNNK